MAYAERRHRGQRRRVDGGPFILHPIEVASLLYYAGAPDHLIAAGILHDTIEKSAATGAELRARFGPRISELVQAVSENSGIQGYAQRKAALRAQVAGAGEEALTLFAADKLAKVRELRVEASSPSTPSGHDRQLAHHLASLSLLEETLPRSPLVRALRREFEMVSRTGAQRPLLAHAR
jgi:(p)ppGpp synthase/HD superfamily hydrolase